MTLHTLGSGVVSKSVPTRPVDGELPPVPVAGDDVVVVVVVALEVIVVVLLVVVTQLPMHGKH